MINNLPTKNPQKNATITDKNEIDWGSTATRSIGASGHSEHQCETDWRPAIAELPGDRKRSPEASTVNKRSVNKQETVPVCQSLITTNKKKIIL